MFEGGEASAEPTSIAILLGFLAERPKICPARDFLCHFFLKKVAKMLTNKKSAGKVSDAVQQRLSFFFRATPQLITEFFYFIRNYVVR
ncbi:MAG TPA: hypothetical protein VMC41_01010 [Candidatus Nanoarchaeia archaeon]|nr:hypothetical protein [Candidatus Nanoarchaeia archaeon]